MEKEDLDKLKEKLYRKGFGESLYPELEKKIAEGTKEFVLLYQVEVGEDLAKYRIHFRHDLETEKVYLNKFDLQLKEAGNTVELSNSFSSNTLITAMEGYRMLKYGDKVAVNKDLFKDDTRYNTWLVLNTAAEKDENGNYPFLPFHENYYKKYPFDLKAEMGKLDVPVKQLENLAYLDSFAKSLKKANLIPVIMMLGGEEMPGFLGVNPEKGKVVLYDSELKPVQAVEQKQDQAKQQSESPGTEQIPKPEATPQNEDVKKKQWNQREQVDWKKNQNRGQRI